MELTVRMRAILSALLAADGYVPAERIASALDVSARTITREMHGLEMALMPYGITLLRRTGAGFMLTGDKADLTRLRTQISKVNVRGELTPDQRRSILVTRLLMADEPLKLFALARILDVTDSTVSHDLDRLQPFLAEQGITRVRRPGLGVYVEGAERDIRSALVRIIHDCMDEKELLALVADDGAEGAASAADRALLGLVDGAQIRTIDDIVAKETHGRDIPDTARVGLVVHLALAVRRMQQHDAIVMDAGTLGELRRMEEFAAARMIAAQLGKVFSLSVPEAEIGYITMHLLGARGTALPAGAGRVDNFRLVQIAQSIMRLASEKSGAPLIRSRTLLSGLVNHLAPALHRLKLRMDIRNPLLAEVEAEHPELMELARYSTRMIEEEVGTPLPADEIAYIAIHIGAALTEAGGDRPVVRVLVACPTGLGTSRLLASRIRRAYERIRVVGELSSLALTAQEINARRAYDIEVVGNEPQTIHVEHVKTINSNTNLEELLDAFVTADIVTTAIGPNILKFIAPNIAKGLARRLEKNEAPLNIIACENMVGGSTVLKNFVYEYLADDVKAKVDRCIGFPDAAVDRIVPIQHNDDPLLVKVEPFAEWDVDRKGVVGAEPQIEGLTWVDNLEAYIEHKLFSVNTGHASIAYMAYLKGIEDIASAMQDEEIVAFVRRVWAETSELLIEKYGFDREKHAAYIRTAEERFKNPHLSDAVTRVARGPKRKLGAKDRLVSPASQLIERGKKPEALATVIAAALHFDYADDPEAVEVQNYIKENGIEKAITHFTEISARTELFKLIIEKNAEMKK